MTPQQLEDLQRMVALRMSLRENAGKTWKERSERLSGRVAAVKMWTADGTRPTFKSALLLAADAVELLAAVDLAEQADWASRDEDAA